MTIYSKFPRWSNPNTVEAPSAQAVRVILRKGRTVGQLFDTQSTHLLPLALPEAAIGQVFLCGLVNRADLYVSFATPDVPCFPASGESDLPPSL